MPGVKLLHQQSDSNTKPEYIMRHSMQAVSMLVRAAKSVFAVPLAVRIHGICRDKEGGSNKRRCDKDYLSDQRVELLGGSLRDASVFHLTLDDHMHDLDATKNYACATKILEAEHRRGAPLDRPMILVG